jgi:DNA-binding response OmpR family regulator
MRETNDRLAAHPRAPFMSIGRQALVVSDEYLAATLVESVARAGYRPRVAQTFVAACADLDAAAPDLLITQVRLAAYNGLHLAIRARRRGARFPVILVGEADPVLKAEADRLDVSYVNLPLDEEGLIAMVCGSDVRTRPARRSPRKPVPKFEALADNVRARVVDISYDGLCLEVSESEPFQIPKFFMLRIPHLNLSWQAQRIWTRDAPGSPCVWCGATLLSVNPAETTSWRAIVDALPGRTLQPQ